MTTITIACRVGTVQGSKVAYHMHGWISVYTGTACTQEIVAKYNCNDLP